ncbi:hypothetical protein Acr_25g0002860 [Actinidia rufa]|uniref:Uncharacterized protein n=1 Tax=Actinidia rufa TaxID=165716 RepID=A0A7J0GYG7_9ERIC|nr:hypothetical protein Acr_25g0002860 [Actinidia rufa]
MPCKTEVGDFENSLPSWVSEHLGETSMTDEVDQYPPPPSEESSPREKLSEIEVPSSPATELNIMTQGNLDCLRETCSFPSGSRQESLGTARLSCLPKMARGPPAMSRDERKDCSSSWGTTGSSTRAFLAKKRPTGSEIMGCSDKRCNKVPALSKTEDERFRRGFEKIGEVGHFKIPVVLDSRTFHKYFAPDRVKISSSSGGTTEGDIGGEAEGDIGGGAVASASTGNVSESSHFKDVPRPEVLSRDDSVEFIGIIGKEMRRILPHRIKLSQLAKVVAKKTATSSSKGVVISEAPKMKPKKRASDDESKGKQVAPLPKAKKTKTGGIAHVVPTWPHVLREGSPAKSVPGEVLGPQASVMASATTVEKILAGVILYADKEKVEKLTFDQVVTKFLHILGQGVVLGSSLAVCSRNFAEGALNQLALVESFELEMVRAQNRAIELEGALVEASAKGKKAVEEVEAKNKEMARLEARVAELEKSQNLVKRRSIATFKESDDFQEAVMGSASSYFGDDFDFCKRQLAQHYPDLGIDLDDIEMDHDFLVKEEGEAEERERKTAEERGEKEVEVEEVEKGG